MVYNSFNSNPPRSLQENAQNCIKFLTELMMAKAAEITEIPQNHRNMI